MATTQNTTYVSYRIIQWLRILATQHTISTSGMTVLCWMDIFCQLRHLGSFIPDSTRMLQLDLYWKATDIPHVVYTPHDDNETYPYFTLAKKLIKRLYSYRYKDRFRVQYEIEKCVSLIDTSTVHTLVTLTVEPYVVHDDVIKWKHFPRYWPSVRGIHRSPVNSPHKSQWHGALMFSLICAWINDWVNNREAGDLRRYRAHYDATVMSQTKCSPTLTHVSRGKLIKFRQQLLTDLRATLMVDA